MTDAELTLLVTRWCEEKPTESPKQGAIYPQNFWRFHEWLHRQQNVWVPTYNFAADLNACAKFEALVEERQVWRRYIEELWVLVSAGERYLKRWCQQKDNTDARVDAQHFAFATATPQQRCEALVAMVGGGDE